MKRILFLLILVSNIAIAQDKNFHSLTSLWNEYYETENTDRPKQGIKVLEKIRKKAESQHLTWDYYDAGQKIINLVSSTNWKQRESTMKQIREDIVRYNEPIVLFFDSYINAYSVANDMEFVNNNRERLEQGYHPAFYFNDPRITRFVFGQALAAVLKNDYDYCLWCLYSVDYASTNTNILERHFQNQYPFDALLELKELNTEGHIAYEKKYSDKAVGLFSTQRLLSNHLDTLIQKGGTSEDFLKLKSDVQATIKKINSFTGDEKLFAQCCKFPENILKQLESSSITCSVEDGTLIARLRNSNYVNITVKNEKGKNLIKERLNNTQKSYFVIDTLNYNLDNKLTDGEYSIEFGTNKTSIINYSKYSLSIACRENSDGYAVFVADYKTGEPVKTCKLTLYDNTDKIIVQSQELAINGFTTLPKSILSKIDNDVVAYQIQAQIIDYNGDVLLSPKHSLRTIFRPLNVNKDNNSLLNSVIISDRAAYNPGDTINFKSIIYTDNSTAQSGLDVLVQLKDPKNKVIDKKTLVTNDFGSIASFFVLPKECLGGNYQININQNNIANSTIYLTVDEFVLPTFTLEWENNNKTYLPGDEIEIKGKIISYSGHSLTSAHAKYQLRAGSEMMAETPLEFDSNGNFSIKFTSDANSKAYYSYSVTVTVSDSTGETWSYNQYINFSTYLSLWLEAKNSAKGNFCLLGNSYQDGGMILNSDSAIIELHSLNREINYKYTLKLENEIVENGISNDSNILEIDFKDKISGLYTLIVEAQTYSDSGNKFSNSSELKILKALDTEKMLNSDVVGFFKEVEGYGLSLQIGATGGPIWAVAELYGNGNQLLDKKIVKLIGQKGRAGSLQLVTFNHESTYPSELSINVLYFRDKNIYQYSKDFEPINSTQSLNIEFSRFLDQTQPNKKYYFALQSEENIEACATIFDISTETIRSNNWKQIWIRDKVKQRVSYNYSCGNNDSYAARLYKDSMMTRSVALALNNEESFVLAEDSMGGVNDPIIRSNFANTIAWEPFLKSNKMGRIDIPFSTSDKLSSYAVQVYAHSKDLRNSIIRKEFLVTIPVKVSLSTPKYLYEGDTYTLNMNVSNMLEDEIVGDVYIQFGDSEIQSQRVTLKGLSSIDYSSTINNVKEGKLDVIVGFRPISSDYTGDAIKTSINIKQSVQTINESHSSLVFETDNKNAIIENLRSQFVNCSAADAQITEISIKDMLNNAIPKFFVPKADDAQSISATLYSLCAMNKNLEADLVEKLIACSNKDGGFAWFPNMSSSPIITVQVLERLHFIGSKLPKELDSLIEPAIKYIDKQYFLEKPLVLWRGGIDLDTYLYIRSLYPEYSFDVLSTKLKSLADFTIEAKKYLNPKKSRGLNAQILDKARRAITLQNYINNPHSTKLFNTWGLDIKINGGLKKSLIADINSLKEYAVEHSSGGYYFPNAVQPFRGILESELYAHSLLCNLFDNQGLTELSEGIRLWIMTQKETQDWGEDPGFIDALCCVLKGSEKTLNTKVISLSSQAYLAFEDIKAVGNGFSIKTEYRLNGRVIQDGDTLKMGDKVIARHSIWSEENRSFVTMHLPRPACLRPVVQTSGFYAWLYGAYRYVRTDESIYYFESFPEETFTINDEFYVVQEGVFQSSVPTIYSTYAPHYRANGTMNQIRIR